MISEYQKLHSDDQPGPGPSTQRVDTQEGSVERGSKPRQGRCGVCNPKGNKKFTARCSNCMNFICKLHRNVICINCCE